LIQYLPFNTDDKSECDDIDCSLFFGALWTTLADDGPASDRE